MACNGFAWPLAPPVRVWENGVLEVSTHDRHCFRRSERTEMAEDIELKAFTIERTTIHTTREKFDAAVRDDIGDYYDAHLSKMASETVIIDPDGAVINPYGGESDLFTLLEPLLDEIPTSRVERYVTDRRSRKSDRN